MLLTASVTGCMSGVSNFGEAVLSVGAKVVLRDVTIKIDEASVRLLVTPTGLQSLVRSVDP